MRHKRSPPRTLSPLVHYCLHPHLRSPPGKALGMGAGYPRARRRLQHRCVEGVVDWSHHCCLPYPLQLSAYGHSGNTPGPGAPPQPHPHPSSTAAPTQCRSPALPGTPGLLQRHHHRQRPLLTPCHVFPGPVMRTGWRTNTPPTAWESRGSHAAQWPTTRHAPAPAPASALIAATCGTGAQSRPESASLPGTAAARARPG